MSGRDTYERIVDELVDRTPSVSARLVREHGLASRARGHEAANALVRRLSAEDREVLAQMLEHERAGAIHDTLAVLTWWLDCGGVTWSAGGEPMPAGLEGGLHADYVGRRTGWAWPR